MAGLVLVHGNPETAAIWGPLLSELGEDGAVTVGALEGALGSFLRLAGAGGETGMETGGVTRAETGPRTDQAPARPNGRRRPAST